MVWGILGKRQVLPLTRLGRSILEAEQIELAFVEKGSEGVLYKVRLRLLKVTV